MRTRIVVAFGWLAITTTAVMLVLGVLGVLGAGILEPPGRTVSQAEVLRELSKIRKSPSPSPSPSPTPSPTASEQPPKAGRTIVGGGFGPGNGPMPPLLPGLTQTVISAPGGSVGASCQNGFVVIAYVAPSPGFAYKPLIAKGAVATVYFGSDEVSSVVEIFCKGGELTFTISN